MKDKLKKNNEATARIKINKLLEQAGWRLNDSEKSRANVILEAGVRLQDAGDNYEKTINGYIDYLLLDDNNYPLCVLEAKSSNIHPLSPKETQARPYAKGKNCRFVILSNGDSHYFWDIESGNPEIITEFPTQATLLHRIKNKYNTSDLVSEIIDSKYLEPKKTLRGYQVEAIHAIQKAAKEGKRRFLLEMATGAGKTTTSGAICKLFLRTGNASRILFLVDRIELETQALNALKNLFDGQYFVEKFKDGNWDRGHIVISTVQTLLAGNKYREYFSPTDFDLVISDEAHRSIGSNSRAVFEYFLGYKLGLTATPKDYLKGVDERELIKKNIKAYEYRNLRDTYTTFSCEDGIPTYRYDLRKGVADNFLINPFVIDARTEITTELISKEGYSMQVENEDGGIDDVFYFAKDFEKKFFNDDTNRVFCETILNNGLLDPLTNEFGKTLVFCVSKSHASDIVNLLNSLADKKWPNKYQSNFAIQVTSGIGEEHKYTKDFANNRLKEKSQFAHDTHPDYNTSKARICVTVGMMTTGYDCPDLLNIVLLRPIFSPTDFIQMKGRGTRKYTFLYQETGESKTKDKFILLDFFANCQYFEKDFDYNKKITLPISKDGTKNSLKDPTPNTTNILDSVDAETPDTIATITQIYIGVEGMKIDRSLYPYQQFEQVIQESKTLKRIKEEQGLDGLEEYIKAEVFNKPTEYWSAEMIRQSYEREYQTKRKISLMEMILKALGMQNDFKSRDERVNEEYQKFIDIQRPQIAEDQVEQVTILKKFFETFVSDPIFRGMINKKEYAGISVYPSFNMQELQVLGDLIEDASNYANEYLQREMAEFDWENK
ncbi:MAG: DEAD/DEAH box helicase family protein [Methylacidiphilales bacterium]|nr:DEAD/DEAH box helicase family protein [Candidatus Methylacidiphilales bacterium]